jgi:hypothetical protein
MYIKLHWLPLSTKQHSSHVNKTWNAAANHTATFICTFLTHAQHTNLLSADVIFTHHYFPNEYKICGSVGCTKMSDSTFQGESASYTLENIAIITRKLGNIVMSLYILYKNHWYIKQHNVLTYWCSLYWYGYLTVCQMSYPGHWPRKL